MPQTAVTAFAAADAAAASGGGGGVAGVVGVGLVGMLVLTSVVVLVVLLVMLLLLLSDVHIFCCFPCVGVCWYYILLSMASLYQAPGTCYIVISFGSGDVVWVVGTRSVSV